MLKYWYPIGTVNQLAFDGRNSVEVDGVPVGEGHIVYNDSLLCGQDRNALKRKSKAKKHSTVKNRRNDAQMCARCLELYKANANFDYMKWVKSVENTSPQE